ncbi:hypothetical protein FIBSPDRAFT_1046467 [Athelia psychrophila]|uniref:Uncharacterized protein n=1 Tax=Athelia psychrophila TaxID=1759441 RepID=A0A166GRW4_9AGAM|nr:hypothetical protein FIBSPDRAFT_1046467 [Fibularhizoctonia sp. CBS 109695]
MSLNRTWGSSTDDLRVSCPPHDRAISRTRSIAFSRARHGRTALRPQPSKPLYPTSLKRTWGFYIDVPRVSRAPHGRAIAGTRLIAFWRAQHGPTTIPPQLAYRRSPTSLNRMWGYSIDVLRVSRPPHDHAISRTRSIHARTTIPAQPSQPLQTGRLACSRLVGPHLPLTPQPSNTRPRDHQVRNPYYVSQVEARKLAQTAGGGYNPPPAPGRWADGRGHVCPIHSHSGGLGAAPWRWADMGPGAWDMGSMHRHLVTSAPSTHTVGASASHPDAGRT